jgi:sugar phosphate isomerase/epimerase
MKLAIYSVTYAGLWYRGRALSLEELINKAAELGYEGIEIEGKRPHGLPIDYSKEKREQIRKLAEEKGVKIIGVAAVNNFVSPVPERRESEIVMVGELIKLAHNLGAKIVRIFADWRGVIIRNGLSAYDIARDDRYQYPSTRLERWNWCKECIKDVAKIAKDYNITLALQNHKPLIRNYKDMLDMVQEVDSDYVKCCLDAPLLNSQEDSYVTEAVRKVGKLQVLSHFGGEFDRQSNGKVTLRDLRPDYDVVNYPAFVKALKEIRYKDYLSYELCHPFIPRNHEWGTLEGVEEQIKLAREYMQNLGVSK